MIRIILAVIAGYVLMAVTVFVLFSGAYLAMGTERAFKPESFETSLLWCLVSLVLGLAAAVPGGWVCARIGRSSTAVKSLAGVVIVLGILAAIMAIMAPAPEGKRTGGIPNLEAMSKAVTPVWVALLNPVVGVLGVMAGGRLGLKQGAPAETSVEKQVA